MKVLVTGGTLDKQYNPLKGSLVFVQTCVEDMLMQARSTIAVDIDVLMLKDSLEMTAADRAIIAAACAETADERIIITHGTDTMVESAHSIAQTLADGDIGNKTIVLLGAMVPNQIKGSDALFNLGCAMTAVQLLPAGVYITMNGRVFDYRDVKKNRELGQFQAQSE